MGRVGFDHRLLRSLLARPDETIRALKRFAAEYREVRLLDLEDQVFDLFKHLRTPEAIPFYFHLMQSQDDGIPDDLVESFAALGAPAVEPLLAKYKELGPEDGADLPFLMAALGVRDPRILAVLLETLERDVYEGGICLGLYGDPAARPHVEASLGRAQSPEERKALQDCLEQLNGSAAREDPEHYEIWDDYPEKALPRIDELPEQDCLAFLDCEEPEYRREAALSFRGEIYGAGVRASLLTHARNDGDGSVRAACLEALGTSLEDRAVLTFLLETLQDTAKPIEERSGALIALAAESKRPEVDRAIGAFYRAPATRAAALNAIVVSQDRRYSALVLEALGSEDHETHRSAIRACGALELGEAGPHLRSLFDHEELRTDALIAYALSAPIRVTSRSIEQLLADIERMAGALTFEEIELVEHALDVRLANAGLPRLFYPEYDDDHAGHHHGSQNIH